MKQTQLKIWIGAGLMGFLAGWSSFAAPSKSTREAANALAFRSVNRVGCSDFEKHFQTELLPLLESLRKNGDVSPKYLKNLVWDYSKRRYGNFGSKYQVSSKALIDLYQGYLATGKVSPSALKKLANLKNTHRISCNDSGSKQAEPPCQKQVSDALQGLTAITLGTEVESKGSNSSCVPDETVHHAIAAEPADSKLTEELIQIALEGTKVERNSARQKVGSKDSELSTLKCGMYVSIALAEAGCRSPSGPAFQEGSAKNLGKDLSANGFKNLMTVDGELPDGINSLYEAPAGSVLVFDGGANGHVEIVGSPGFISDYWSKSPRTGPKGAPSGNQRRLIGIWVKPSCGAGS